MGNSTHIVICSRPTVMEME